MGKNEWVVFSERDLRRVKDNFKIGDYGLVSFLCQQSIEKALKAVLIKRTGDFPKVHDLVKLSNLVELDGEFLKKCEGLTSVYIESRYPGVIEEEHTKSEAISDIKLAEEILKWTKERL